MRNRNYPNCPTDPMPEQAARRARHWLERQPHPDSQRHRNIRHRLIATGIAGEATIVESAIAASEIVAAAIAGKITTVGTGGSGDLGGRIAQGRADLIDLSSTTVRWEPSFAW
mgnify:CR=1 FL=1